MTAPGLPDPPRAPVDAPPPVLGSWRNVYLVVALSQAAVIGLLALLAHLYG